jgi:hypothetical protein
MSPPCPKEGQTTQKGNQVMSVSREGIQNLAECQAAGERHIWKLCISFKPSVGKKKKRN